MNGVLRWTVGAAALIVLGNCTAIPDQSRPDPGIQPTPPSARQTMPTAHPRQTAASLSFSYSGTREQGGAIIGIAPAGTRALMLDGAPVAVAADGRFFIAFDRDAAPIADVAATLDDGRVVRDTLTIAARGWRIERLDSLPRFAQETAEFNRLRPGELAQIAEARRIDSGSQGWRQRFMWPVTGRISGLFGAQRVYKNGEAGAYHSGVDVARPQGTMVLAPADGVVILAADHPFTLEGNLLMIDHGMGLNTAFLHLSRIDVHVGDHVRQGQPVGAIGMTGRATGSHLHWSMKWRSARIDPLLLAGAM